MVLVATRRDTGKAQALGLTSIPRLGKPDYYEEDAR